MKYVSGKVSGKREHDRKRELDIISMLPNNLTEEAIANVKPRFSNIRRGVKAQ